MQKQGIAFGKIHDLDILLQSCLTSFPLWLSMRGDMELLTQYALHFRYPGESADETEAKQAIDAMQRCRMEIRTVL